ncbi:MAG: formylglycine-generating enzyme family protein [Elusimicrobiaceae bacterium]|nr:formylglycine-generating enzyme family protein [Elusimicrobiaceae bacterium]
MNPAFSEQCDKCGRPFRSGGGVRWLLAALLLGAVAYGGSEFRQKFFSRPAARPGCSQPQISEQPALPAEKNAAVQPPSSHAGRANPDGISRLGGLAAGVKGFIAGRIEALANGLSFGVKRPDGPAAPARVPPLYSRARAAEVRDMVLFEAGPSVLGSTVPSSLEAHYDEKSSAPVFVDAFFIDRYEVTVGSYAVCAASGACRVPPANPGCSVGADKNGYPANCITWQNASDYCRWAGKRLPYEAEWEKAARAGTETQYFFGDSADDLELYGWYKRNARGGPHPVGQLAPNGKGLYDIYGNVWEWTQDWYDPKSYDSHAPGAMPKGPETGDRRVLRGGSYTNDIDALRSAFRNKDVPTLISPQRGFRCAADVLE